MVTPHGSVKMAVDRGQFVQIFEEGIKRLAVCSAPGRIEQLDAEGEKPGPCSGPGSGSGSEHPGGRSFQRLLNAAASRTDSG